MSTESKLHELLKKYENDILRDWLKEQRSAVTQRTDLISDAELEQQAKEFLAAFQEGVRSGELTDITSPAWETARALLENLSKVRAGLGFSPSETSTFVFSLKQPVFTLLLSEFEKSPKTLAAELWSVTVIVDKLGLFTAECFLRRKEELIRRQQDEMLELSTPVVKLWDQILALPLIGTLDSARTQVVMENLLQEIVNTSSSVAIIDITGVPTVDTLVAQHLMKTVAAARLMGAECIISGIRPQIAQAMVHLGVAFNDIVTKATLADAIRHAFAKTGFRVSRVDAD